MPEKTPKSPRGKKPALSVKDRCDRILGVLSRGDDAALSKHIQAEKTFKKTPWSFAGYEGYTAALERLAVGNGPKIPPNPPLLEKLLGHPDAPPPVTVEAAGLIYAYAATRNYNAAALRPCEPDPVVLTLLLKAMGDDTALKNRTLQEIFDDAARPGDKASIAAACLLADGGADIDEAAAKPRAATASLRAKADGREARLGKFLGRISQR